MRKTIGICVSGYNWEVESKVVQGICSTAREKDTNILIFSSLLSKNDIKNINYDSGYIVKGESEIFNLINYKLIDGLIIISGTLISWDSVRNIIEQCKKNDVPLVNVNSNNPEIEYNVEVEGISAFDTLIEHLIVEHNCKTINFIGGFPSEIYSDKRLNAYKKVLTRYNIPVEEKRIGYGHYWNRSVEVVKKFIEDKVFPDAIICANDTMAIFVMDYLTNSGYKVPEDVIVTGYDGISDGERYQIPVTSVMHDYIKAGQVAFFKAYALAERKTGNKKNGRICKNEVISSLFLKRASCGCGNKITKQDFFGENFNELSSYNIFTDSLSYMSKICGSTESWENLYAELVRGLKSFNFTRIFININSEIVKNGELFHYSSEREKNRYGLAKKMVSMVQKGHNTPPGTEFATDKMIPEDLLNNENPIILAFTPLYFKDRFLGYVTFEPWKIKGNGKLFSLWLLTASNLIGSFYSKAELEHLYMTDPLTGLYNRRGMKKKFDEAFVQIKEKNEYCGIICGDIDNLKKINDKYGHEAGDIAITTSAKAQLKSLPKDSICVKTGGDEFCALVHSQHILKMDALVGKVYDYLDKFNEKSELPYKVYCSCGYCMEIGADIKNLVEMQNKADKELYIEKNSRKIQK